HRPSNTSETNASAGSTTATAPMIAAGWRHPKRNEWMPSTNTETAMPTHSASPRAASVSPASGPTTAQSHTHPPPTHTTPHPTPHPHHPWIPPALVPAELPTVPNEQWPRRRHDQSPHHPACGRRSAVEAHDL